MRTLTISLPHLHTGQREVWDHPARFQVLSCGRRWGKTRMGALRCIAEATQGRRAWWVAPSYPMSAVGWRMIHRLATQIPGVVIRQGDRIIELPGGGTVQVRSADNPDSLRGEGLDYLVMDECAFIKQDAWTEALRPALADRQGKALFISTPKGRNWFWRLWMIDDGEQYKSWQFTSYDNPYVKDSEIDAAKANLPERIFLQEFMADFIEDGAGVFRRVMDAATSKVAEPAPGKQYVMGVDWGKSNDFTVITTLDTQGHMVHVDRFNQIDYTVQVGRLRALAERYKPTAIIAERNSMGDPLAEQLLRAGLPVQPFTTTNATKTAIIDGLALAFERGEVAILPDPALVGELQAYEMERLKSGLLRYSAPDGMHDDMVMSLALAWYGIGRPTASSLVDFA